MEMGHMLSSGNCGLETTHRQKRNLGLSWQGDAAYPEKAGSLIASKSLAPTLIAWILQKLESISLMSFWKK